MLRLAAAVLLLGALAGPARADPGYYVVTAYENAGQAAAELRYWSVKREGRAEDIWPEVGFSQGITSRWTTGLLYSTIGSSNWKVEPSLVAWANDILLTQGEQPVDLALHTNLIRELGQDGGLSVEFGPTLQTDIGRTQFNANLFFERQLSGADVKPVQMKYQWQVRHRLQPMLNVGLQGFGELGQWDHWSAAARQSHRAGPAWFGRLGLGEREALLMQAAYLLGTVYRRHGSMFTLRVQYTF